MGFTAPVLQKIGIDKTGASAVATNGLPVGGTEDQLLAKNSATNFDTKWVDSPSGGDSPSYLRTVRADSETIYSATNASSDSDSNATWKIVKEVTSGVTRNLLSLYTATDSWDNYLTTTYVLSKTYNL